MIEQVLNRVRLRIQRRWLWLEQINTGQSPVSTLLADRDNPADEAAFYATLDDSLAPVEAALEGDQISRLALLRRIFSLDPLDVDVLHACLAPALDAGIRQLYIHLHGLPYATESLIARLFGYGRYLLWNSESALRRWETIIEEAGGPGEPPALLCDRAVRDWLLGQDALDPALVGHAELRPPLDPLPDWPVVETVAFIRRSLSREPAVPVRVMVTGSPGSGRRTFAAVVSAQIGMPLLCVNTAGLDVHKALRAQRQAFLQRCTLAWYGDSVPPENDALTPFPVQFVVGESAATFIHNANAARHYVKLSAPPLETRRALWGRYIPTLADNDAFAARFGVNVGDIVAAARQPDTSPELLGDFLRETRRGHLGELARRLDCPFDWDDLVVDDRVRAALEDLVFEAQDRAIFWEYPPAKRLFPQGRGLVGLFSGPPGTGKTMAAQVLAASLGLDLFRIDLSAVVSKYVGETSQNLERILSRAGHMDIVLLFDEADALFGKRTEIKEANDRFANTDTNYLLQALESYAGVVLLATNKRANLDPAFIRRLRYVLEFSRPDAAQRREIWQRVIGELAGAETVQTLSASLDRLANDVDSTHAQIKYAVLSAIFAARRDNTDLKPDHLLRGLDRELMKEGRALNERERERLFAVGSAN